MPAPRPSAAGPSPLAPRLADEAGEPPSQRRCWWCERELEEHEGWWCEPELEKCEVWLELDEHEANGRSSLCARPPSRIWEPAPPQAARTAGP